MNSEDLLIGRIVDRDDQPRDWRELDRLGCRRAELWQDLLYALRQDASVRAAVAPRLDAACRAGVASAGPMLRWGGAWMGWLAAVLVVCAWIVTSGVRQAEQPTVARSNVPTESHDVLAPDARVLRELPRMVVEARPIDGGEALEVLYVRRVLERAVVRELYELSEDEQGVPVPTQVNLARFESPSSF